MTEIQTGISLMGCYELQSPILFFLVHRLRILTLPLPISHLCENYLPLPVYQFRIYAKYTCVHALITMDIFHYMHG